MLDISIQIQLDIFLHKLVPRQLIILELSFVPRQLIILELSFQRECTLAEKKLLIWYMLDWIHLVDFLPFLREKTCHFLFAFQHIKSLVKRTLL